jgi:hypothetical protein
MLVPVSRENVFCKRQLNKNYMSTISSYMRKHFLRMCHILEFTELQKYVFNIITKRGHAKCEFLIFILLALYVEYIANRTNRVTVRVRWRIFSNSVTSIIFLKSVRIMRVLHIMRTLWSPIIHVKTDFFECDTAGNFVNNSALHAS